MASEPTPQQLITQSAQTRADAIASVLTAGNTSISLATLSPFFCIPWRTGSSSTASCLTVRITSDMSLQPWEPNPWRCMCNG